MACLFSRLFVEKWLQPDACRRLKFIKKCDPQAHLISSSGGLRNLRSKYRLVSIVDGIALDIESNSYCELAERMKDIQRQSTYMKDYKEAIRIAKNYDAKEWNDIYYRSDGTARMSLCETGSTDPFCIDGMNWGDWEKMHFLLPPSYCEKCSPIRSTLLDPSGSRFSLNCNLTY